MSGILALLLLAAAAWAAIPAAQADALHCTVRSVHDGDSMRVQCPGERRTTAIRMHQVDAPELDQAYGRQARDRLRRLCPAGTTAVIHTQGRDQYGRLLGDVDCGGKSVNEEMIASGSAWIYDRYVKDRELYRLQDRARAAGRGLWADRNPQAPWRWRYEQRNTD